MFNRLKKWFFKDYEVSTRDFPRSYMTREQLNERSEAADEAMVRIQLAIMAPSQRYEYHIEELRWRLMVGIAPQSRINEIKAMGHEALTELRSKYATLITPDVD